MNAPGEGATNPSPREQNPPNKLQKRQSSYGNDMPPRPQSRSASNLMNASGDYTAHLSAREQEHVARATGSPLINMGGNTNKHTPPPSGGLIGAIEAREKERKDIKEGLSGQMVQHAIAQQKQHHQQQRQTSYGSPAQQYATPQPQYAMPGGFPPSPTQYTSYPIGQQQYAWNSPQQQQQPYQQYPQHSQPQWTPPSAGQFVGPQQHLPYQHQAQQSHQGVNQQGQYQQGQQQYSGGYFGNGQNR